MEIIYTYCCQDTSIARWTLIPRNPGHAPWQYAVQQFVLSMFAGLPYPMCS
jgi:hypothetical protein